MPKGFSAQINERCVVIWKTDDSGRNKAIWINPEDFGYLRNLMGTAEQKKLESEKEPPPKADFSARILTDGSPVPEDNSHTALRPDGQQKAYVVLTEEERSKGFVRPYRDAYRHLKCGKITTMGRAIAETYARCPIGFYSGTFCTTCIGHFPIGEDGEFTWYEMDGTEGPKVGT